MSFSGTLFDLSGKVAVITGSSRGIGRAIALRMAQHGARVVVSSRKEPACEAVAAEIRAAGGEAMVKACNIARKEELQALVDAAVAAWGRLDVLVCNAAVNPWYGPSAEMPDEAFDKIMACNVRSNFWLCNMALPHIAAAGGGAVVIVSSIAGLQGNDRLGAYGISKAADMQLARNIALEWGTRKVRANCITPGLVRTDFARALWENPDNHRRAVELSCLGRIGEPDEIAGIAVLLAAQAGEFITGQSIVADGGRTVGGRIGAS